jgi:chloramphenicol 3-O phosphotransferase
MNTKSKIIFLNGVGSVGKTSIAKALQTILEEAYLHVSIDQFIDMLPEKYIGNPNGIFFEPLQNANHPTVKVNTGEVGNKLMKGMRLSIASLATQGNNLIIDEVILGDEMDEYTKLLSNFKVFYVGIFAPLSVIEDRERNRKDRTIGLARWQYDIVHKNITYDLQIDTTELSATDAAKLIKSHFNL